jgi:hypothetical protein
MGGGGGGRAYRRGGGRSRAGMMLPAQTSISNRNYEDIANWFFTLCTLCQSAGFVCKHVLNLAQIFTHGRVPLQELKCKSHVINIDEKK